MSATGEGAEVAPAAADALPQGSEPVTQRLGPGGGPAEGGPDAQKEATPAPGAAISFTLLVEGQEAEPDRKAFKLNSAKPFIKIGRKPGNDISLPASRDVSGEHAVVFLHKGKKLAVRNLSQHGTGIRHVLDDGTEDGDWQSLEGSAVADLRHRTSILVPLESKRRHDKAGGGAKITMLFDLPDAYCSKSRTGRWDYLRRLSLSERSMVYHARDMVGSLGEVAVKIAKAAQQPHQAYAMHREAQWSLQYLHNKEHPRYRPEGAALLVQYLEDHTGFAKEETNGGFEELQFVMEARDFQWARCRLPETPAPAGHHAGRYVVLELVRGRLLQSILDDESPKSVEERQAVVEERQAVVTQCVAALSYLKDFGLVHRGIRPSNLMVVGEGPTCGLKVLDFSCMILSDTSQADNRNPAVTCGLLGVHGEWIPPEVRKSSASGNFGTPGSSFDAFSFGVLVLVLAIGRKRAKKFLDRDSIQYEDLTRKKEDLNALGISPALLELLLQKHPKRRPLPPDILRALRETLGHWNSAGMQVKRKAIAELAAAKAKRQVLAVAEPQANPAVVLPATIAEAPLQGTEVLTDKATKAAVLPTATREAPQQAAEVAPEEANQVAMAPEVQATAEPAHELRDEVTHAAVPAAVAADVLSQSADVPAEAEDATPPPPSSAEATMQLPAEAAPQGGQPQDAAPPEAVEKKAANVGTEASSQPEAAKPPDPVVEARIARRRELLRQRDRQRAEAQARQEAEAKNAQEEQVEEREPRQAEPAPAVEATPPEQQQAEPAPAAEACRAQTAEEMEEEKPLFSDVVEEEVQQERSEQQGSQEQEEDVTMPDALEPTSEEAEEAEGEGEDEEEEEEREEEEEAVETAMQVAGVGKPGPVLTSLPSEEQVKRKATTELEASQAKRQVVAGPEAEEQVETEPQADGPDALFERLDELEALEEQQAADDRGQPILTQMLQIPRSKPLRTRLAGQATSAPPQLDVAPLQDEATAAPPGAARVKAKGKAKAKTKSRAKSKAKSKAKAKAGTNAEAALCDFCVSMPHLGSIELDLDRLPMQIKLGIAFLRAIAPWEVISEEQARQQPPYPLLPPQREEVRGRRTLLLDLDDTLVHCSQTNPFQPADGAKVLSLEVQQGLPPMQVQVSLRPWVNEFLERVAKVFEVVIFTASAPVYADQVVDLLDPTKTMVERTLLCRSACTEIRGGYLKDLRRLGRNLEHVVLADNSPLAGGMTPMNTILVKSWYGEEPDSELQDLWRLCEELATAESIPRLLESRYGFGEFLGRQRDDFVSGTITNPAWFQARMAAAGPVATTAGPVAQATRD